MRRLMRRMRYHLTKLYTDTNFDKKNIQHIVQTLFGAVIAKYSVSYDHLLPNQKNIFHMSSKEIIQFESTLQKGSSILD
ncbi:hypothetical protein GW750_05910 [bacterium]|nr:hypothetical protein [bacterium]